MGNTQSLHQLHTAACNMDSELMGGRAEAVCSTLELGHLGKRQLGEQVRSDPNALAQVQVVSRTINGLSLTSKVHRQIPATNPGNQNIRLQAVNPKPVLGTKVTKSIKQLLQ